MGAGRDMVLMFLGAAIGTGGGAVVTSSWPLAEMAWVCLAVACVANVARK